MPPPNSDLVLHPPPIDSTDALVVGSVVVAVRVAILAVLLAIGGAMGAFAGIWVSLLLLADGRETISFDFSTTPENPMLNSVFLFAAIWGAFVAAVLFRRAYLPRSWARDGMWNWFVCCTLPILSVCVVIPGAQSPRVVLYAAIVGIVLSLIHWMTSARLYEWWDNAFGEE